MSQCYKFTRVPVQTVCSFPALPFYMFDGCSYPKLWDGRKKMKLPWGTYAAVVTSVVASTLIHGAPPHWHTEPIFVSRLWKIVSHLLSQISFHCTTYIYYKFHIMDSCCLRHKFHLVAIFIADFISDVTDFILTSRVTPLTDFILLTTLDSCHSTSYFHHKNYTTDFISLHFVL